MPHFENTFSGFVALIRSLPEDLFLKPMDGWSPRDIVAHLVGWNGLMLLTCQDILQGKTPSYYAHVGDDYREINAGFVARFASTDRELLLDQLITSKLALIAFVQSLEPSEWDADHGVLHHRGGSATVARVLASLEGDYRDHTGQIETWLRQVGIESTGSTGS